MSITKDSPKILAYDTNKLLSISQTSVGTRIVEALIHQQLGSRSTSNLHTYTVDELGQVVKSSCTHDKMFRTLFLLSARNGQGVDSILVSDISHFNTSGYVFQEVSISDSYWEYQQIVFDPNKSLLYLLSSKEGSIRIEAIPVDPVDNTTTRLRYDGKSEVLQARVSTKTTTFHSLIIYPQCNLLYFLSDDSKPSLYTIDLETATLKETKLKVDMRERVVIMKEGALVVDYRTGFLWAIGCKGDCERKNGETLLLHISDTGIVSYNGTIVANGHDDTNTITAFDQLYGTLYVLSQSKLFAATIQDREGTMLDTVPLLYHTYGDDNGGLGTDCFLFVPSASKLPALEVGLGECNLQHKPAPSPSFITPVPRKTPTIPPTTPPTSIVTPTPKPSSRPIPPSDTGSIIGVVTGGSFLFLLTVGFTIWWKASTSFSGHSPLANEDAIELDDLESSGKAKENTRRIKHRRFHDEDEYNGEEKGDHSWREEEPRLDEEEVAEEETIEAEAQRKVKPHSSIFLEDDEDEEIEKGTIVTNKDDLSDFREDFRVTAFLEEPLEETFRDFDDHQTNKNEGTTVEEENVFDIE